VRMPHCSSHYAARRCARCDVLWAGAKTGEIAKAGSLTATINIVEVSSTEPMGANFPGRVEGEKPSPPKQQEVLNQFKPVDCAMTSVTHTYQTDLLTPAFL